MRTIMAVINYGQIPMGVRQYQSILDHLITYLFPISSCRLGQSFFVGFQLGRESIPTSLWSWS